MQSRSVARFRSFPLEKRFNNDLPPHIKGAAVWHDFQDNSGYFVFDVLCGTHLPIEYNKDTHQWYFIHQDSRSRKWNAVNTVPQSYNLGRQSIHASHITAAEAQEDITFRTYGEPDQDSQRTVEQIKTSNILSSTITDNLHSSAMSQTMSALTLAGTATTRSHKLFMGFSIKGKGPPSCHTYLAVEEDPQAADQKVHQAGAHQEEEEACQAAEEPSLPLYLEYQQEVEES